MTEKDLKVGDRLTLTPTLDAQSGMGSPGPLPCTVIFVHLQGRFYTVEFQSAVTAQRWRECFWTKIAPDEIRRDRHSPKGARHNGRKL